MKQARRPYSSPYLKRASVLITALWILAIFAVLAAGLYGIVSAQLSLTRYMENRIISQYLAKSGVIYARYARKKDTTKFDALNKFRTKQETELGRGKFIYTIIDEESKININSAPFEVIQRLPGLDSDLAQKIMASKLRPFALKEELLLVEDMTPEIYGQLKDFVTVYGEGRVNINTAGREVLKALGFDDESIRIIRQFRAGEDGKEGTEDDGVFTDSAKIIEDLRALAGFSAAHEAKILQVLSKGLITVKSENLNLEIETEVLGRPAIKYTVLFNQEKIREWHEY